MIAPNGTNDKSCSRRPGRLSLAPFVVSIMVAAPIAIMVASPICSAQEKYVQSSSSAVAPSSTSIGAPVLTAQSDSEPESELKSSSGSKLSSEAKIGAVTQHADNKQAE